MGERSPGAALLTAPGAGRVRRVSRLLRRQGDRTVAPWILLLVSGTAIIAAVGAWLVAGGWQSPAMALVLGVVAVAFLRFGPAVVGRPARHEQELVRRVRDVSFPLYGLPSTWVGTRYLGGGHVTWSAGQGSEVTEVCLGHGDPRADRGLLLTVSASVAGTGSAATRADKLRRRHSRTSPAASWRTVTVQVDGSPIAVEAAVEGRRWLAYADVGGVFLEIRARDLPIDSLRLVRIVDLSPYLPSAADR